MSDGAELVARYDRAGRQVGTARRADVRALGLWHAAGVVLVRSGDGEQVYVHLRAPDKDVYPSAYDCWAGGVVAAAETPTQCATRELGEELGIRGVWPTPLYTLVFEQPPVRCHHFAYEVRWDGPVVQQPTEIVDGRWMRLDELREWADDPTSPLVPDGRLNIVEWFRRYG